jgi:rRNA maturation RNase YbeY
LACHDVELSILFTDDNHIAQLNFEYLGRKGPTNVLAFPMSGGPPPIVDSGMLGNVVISVETATLESRKLGETLDETIYRLLIHGLLHLLDYDHERSIEDARRMEKEQRRLLTLIREEM